MSGQLKQTTKKRKQKQKPSREDDIPPDLKFSKFIFFSNLTQVFQGLHIFYCSLQARRKRRWEEESKEGWKKGWEACEETGEIQRKSCKSTFLIFVLFSATPVHWVGSDDPVELIQDWLPGGQNQQDPTERTCCSTFSKVRENSSKHSDSALDLILAQVQCRSCDWESVQSVWHAEHRTGKAGFS